MSNNLRRRCAPAAVLAGLIPVALLAAPAGAAGNTIRCTGNGDFCAATVSIAGGASNRVVTINLTDTDFTRVGVRVIPAASKGAFSISKAGFRAGASQYRFTLNAVKANPRGARIILLFAAGTSD